MRFLILVLFLSFATPAFADSVMFIDEGGNIHFVDNWRDVPPQYRNQLRKSPTPMADPKTIRKMEAERKKQEQKAEQEQKKRLAEEKQRRIREENQKYKVQSSPKPKEPRS